MAYPKNEQLNKSIVLLRKLGQRRVELGIDKKNHYTFRVLADIFSSDYSKNGKLSVSTVKEKWDRYKDDYQLDKEIKP